MVNHTFKHIHIAQKMSYGQLNNLGRQSIDQVQEEICLLSERINLPIPVFMMVVAGIQIFNKTNFQHSLFIETRGTNLQELGYVFVGKDGEPSQKASSYYSSPSYELILKYSVVLKPSHMLFLTKSEWLNEIAQYCLAWFWMQSLHQSAISIATPG